MGKQVYKHGYSAKLDRVVDGDTVDALIDLGFDTWKKVRICNVRLGRLGAKSSNCPLWCTASGHRPNYCTDIR